jgi:hypothetical protein
MNIVGDGHPGAPVQGLLMRSIRIAPRRCVSIRIMPTGARPDQTGLILMKKVARRKLAAAAALG